MSGGGGLAKRVHAWVLAHLAWPYERKVAARKRRLLGKLAGTVLEIGPGAGPNLRYYPPGILWMGIDANPHFGKYLEREAARLSRPVILMEGSADRIPMDDDVADYVVSTLVLCSVADVRGVLEEVKRVLRPGGRLVFIEHVAAPDGSRLRRWQERLRGLWGAVADGCRPDQDTASLIEESGFGMEELERFSVPALLASPHVAGVAVPPAAQGSAV